MSLDWMLRFRLDLPCRREDLQDIRRVLPELFDDRLEQFPLHERQIFFPYYFDFDDWKELKKWTQEPNHSEGEAVAPVSSEHCPLDLCPLKTRDITANRQGASSRCGQEDESTILQLMTLGGRIGAWEASEKRSREQKMANDHLDSMSDFQKLLRKVHPSDEGKNIRSVILTDPYLHMQFDNAEEYFLKYLSAIGLPKIANAVVKISPRIKKTSAGFIKIEKALKSRFPNAVLTHHAPKRRFHDRFFLVHYENGQARGVFGPSLNSLAANDIYLMGELEPHCVNALGVREL